MDPQGGEQAQEIKGARVKDIKSSSIVTYNKHESVKFHCKSSFTILLYNTGLTLSQRFCFVLLKQTFNNYHFQLSLELWVSWKNEIISFYFIFCWNKNKIRIVNYRWSHALYRERDIINDPDVCLLKILEKTRISGPSETLINHFLVQSKTGKWLHFEWRRFRLSWSSGGFANWRPGVRVLSSKNFCNEKIKWWYLVKIKSQLKTYNCFKNSI